MYLFTVKINGTAYEPKGYTAINAVAEGLPEAVNAAVLWYSENRAFADSSHVIGVERGEAVHTVA